MRWLGLVFCVACLVGCSGGRFFLANAPSGFYRVERRVDLPYGQDPRQKLDVYAPRAAAAANRSRPVVIFWYGGSWTFGRKSDYRFVGALLAARGFVAVLPDYRLYPQVTFPGFDADGARAVAWVEQHAGEFGGDPHRIVLMGHSAGAHTAAFLALNHEFLRKYGADPASVVGLVGLSGPYALVPDTDTLRATFPSPPFSEADWQPVKFADEHSPPTLLIHGLDDKVVYSKHTTELRDALLAHHVRVEVTLLPHRGHADTVAPFALLARWRAPVVDEVVGFVGKVAGNRADPGAAVR